jgi:hypothetical protein
LRDSLENPTKIFEGSSGESFKKIKLKFRGILWRIPLKGLKDSLEKS